MKYWGSIRGQILLILIYEEFPRLKLLLLTKPNYTSTNFKDIILTQEGWGGGWGSRPSEVYIMT